MRLDDASVIRVGQSRSRCCCSPTTTTGAPTGLVKDPWNIRLLPHYWLAVFFVLAHLAAGARVVIMAHGVSKAFADRFMVGGATVAGIVATVIMLGMCGMRVRFI